MDFSRLEQEFLQTIFRKDVAEEMLKGALDLNEFAMPGEDRHWGDHPAPNSVGLAALLMIAHALGNSEAFERCLGAGRMTVLRVDNADWVPAVARTLANLLDNRGRTSKTLPHHANVNSSSAAYYVLATEDTSLPFRRSSAGREPKTFTADDILTVIATRRPLFVVTSSLDFVCVPPHLLIDDLVEVPDPDQAIMMKLAHFYGNGQPMPTDLVSPETIDPRDVAVAFRSTRSPSATLELLAALGQSIPEPAPAVVGSDDFDISEMVWLGPIIPWARDLKRDADAVRSGEIPATELSGGILIDGPPGTGKTRAAKAISDFTGLPMVSGSVGQWLGNNGGHLGTLVIAMRRAFSEAAAQAPCLLVIDEIDAFPTRGDDAQRFWDAAVAALLDAIDGLDAAPGIVLVGLCNDPAKLDGALKRAGRFDHKVSLVHPDLTSLAAIFKHCLVPDLQHEDFRPLAALVLGATIADVSRICRDGRRKARHEGRTVTLSDLEAIVGSGRLAPSTQRRIAVHEAGHTLLALIEDIPFEAVALTFSGFGGNTLGYLETSSKEWTGTLTQVMAKVRVLLAGRAAEALVLGEPSRLAEDDLQNATRLLFRALGAGGLGKTLRWHNTQRLNTLNLPQKLADDIERILQRCDRETAQVLARNRRVLESIADVLTKETVLDAARVQAIADGFTLHRMVTSTAEVHGHA